jgi:murein DD-endopeptidase MepM/ murein hydrolase activator NlpD
VTLYAHNQRNLVVAGQRVGQGETIALLGGTGRSMGPHVPPIEGPSDHSV